MKKNKDIFFFFIVHACGHQGNKITAIVIQNLILYIYIYIFHFHILQPRSHLLVAFSTIFRRT